MLRLRWEDGSATDCERALMRHKEFKVIAPDGSERIVRWAGRWAGVGCTDGNVRILWLNGKSTEVRAVEGVEHKELVVRNLNGTTSRTRWAGFLKGFECAAAGPGSVPDSRGEGSVDPEFDFGGGY